MQSLLDDALSRGATLLTGGKAHPLGGNFFTPTVIGDVQPGSLLLQEEIFGPVAALVKFDDEQQVIEQANNTIYGLASYFFTATMPPVSGASPSSWNTAWSASIPD